MRLLNVNKNWVAGANGWFTFIASLQLALLAGAQTKPDYDLAPVHYTTSKDVNTITRLQVAMDEQKFTLPQSSSKDVLRAILEELKIPVSSL